MVVFGATGDTTKFAPLQSRSFFPSTGGGRGLSLPAWLRAPEAVPGTDALMLLRRMGKAPLLKYVAVRVDAPNSWIATRSERPHCSVFSFCLCYGKTKLFPEDGVPNHPTTDLYSFFFFFNPFPEHHRVQKNKERVVFNTNMTHPSKCSCSNIRYNEFLLFFWLWINTEDGSPLTATPKDSKVAFRIWVSKPKCRVICHFTALRVLSLHLLMVYFSCSYPIFLFWAGCASLCFTPLLYLYVLRSSVEVVTRSEGDLKHLSAVFTAVHWPYKRAKRKNLRNIIHVVYLSPLFPFPFSLLSITQA